MSGDASLVVAVAQIESVAGDIAVNARKHVDVIDAARGAGADVLVFPELSLAGHSGGRDAIRVAMRRSDALLVELAEAAGPMCTVVGLVEEGDGAQFYNAAAALRDGKVAAVHRKINLATYGRLEDGKHFAAGAQVNAFDLAPDWLAAIFICADLWNPALVHLAAAQHATLLLAPISSAREAVGDGFDNPAGWDLNLRFHALTYGFPIAMANRVGCEDGFTFFGASRIVDPFGRTLAQAEGEREALLHARIAFSDVRRARYRLPTVRDANLPLVGREIARILRG